MKLYGSYTSPFVRHCRILLLESGLPCEFIVTDGAASAAKSPAKKVPFLEDGELFLTDSCSIIKYLREKNMQAFCFTAIEYDRFCLVNTLLEASVNLFMLEKDGILPAQSAYLQRHVARIQSGLATLDGMRWPSAGPYNDAELRLLCFLDWALFRKRFTFDEYTNLTAFLAAARAYQPFTQTIPHG